ncbi:hypothetical protein ACIBBE_42290 [Streptomyces sp. NPDC051644]|uniref:hypothetical protein n=1 Tax=Streptomyces sp. NPDC051644 TaxID=3365666 RepID=UPI0037A231FC
MRNPLAPAAPESADDVVVAGPLQATHMPYIAMTANERFPVPDLVPGPGGWIAYRTAGPYDRYPGIDVLLARTEGAPGGKVDGALLSPMRQFDCMDRRRCQGCGDPASYVPGKGTLWVRTKVRETGESTPRTGPTDMPPSCARCALHWCPVLEERGRQLLWVRKAELVGVFATVYPPPRGTAVPEQLVLWADQRTLSAAVATRLVCDLQKVTPADREFVARLAAQQGNR